MSDLNNFLNDLPDDQPPIVKPRPILKEQLTTAHILKMNDNFKSITSLATSITYCQHLAREHAQTVYVLIDDATPQGEEIDPMLGQSYQALTRAAQLLFEAETHLYRFANKLENERYIIEEQQKINQMLDALANGSSE